MSVEPTQALQALARVKEGKFEAALTFIETGPGILKSFRWGKDPPIGYRNAQVVQLIDRTSVTRDPDELDRSDQPER